MTPGVRIDLIRTMVSYHEELDRTRSAIETIRTLAIQRRYDSVKEALNQLISKHLIPHFEFEEVIVFPAIRKSAPPANIKDTVSQCISEHTVLRSELNDLLAVLGEAETEPLSGAVDPTPYTLANLHSRILSHAAREDAILIPYVNAHEEIRFLMGHRFLQYRSGYESRFAPELSDKNRDPFVTV